MTAFLVIFLMPHKIEVSASCDSKGYQPGRAYCEELKVFSLTLFSYSMKAYNFLCESMGNAIPNESIIEKWFLSESWVRFRFFKICILRFAILSMADCKVIMKFSKTLGGIF